MGLATHVQSYQIKSRAETENKLFYAKDNILFFSHLGKVVFFSHFIFLFFFFKMLAKQTLNHTEVTQTSFWKVCKYWRLLLGMVAYHLLTTNTIRHTHTHKCLWSPNLFFYPTLNILKTSPQKIFVFCSWTQETLAKQKTKKLTYLA